MELQSGLVTQLEDMLASRDLSRRAEILRRVTDLFVLGSGHFSDDQVELFDSVMGKLLEHVETAARAQFGRRIAKLSDAPPKVVRELAFDDAIDVAGPVLRHCGRLDDATLIESARTKSQDHLLAISGRAALGEAITDVLVERGNTAVISSTARNRGARFSERGMSALVDGARGNGELALCVWSRPDIPRQNLTRMFVEASEAVREQMTEADPRRAELIKAVVTAASDQLMSQARAASDTFADALSSVSALHASGGLNEERLMEFAKQGSFDKVAAALSLMCNLPIGVVEQALVHRQTDQILVLAKAIDLSWVTTVALLLLQAGINGTSRQQLDQCFTSFSRLQPKSAQTALQFYRMRAKANRPTS
jgi:uncharacterized protein (DUF2336 family)